MSNYRRLYMPGGTYFFTVNLRHRDARLLVDEIDALRAAYRKVQLTWPFTTVAICVLPNHLHCVWTLPEGDDDFSTRWKLIRTHFSKSLPRALDLAPSRRKGERGIWQRRFWERLVKDEDELQALVDYVHINPVKHGLVSEVSDWPYSSWHRARAEYVPKGGGLRPSA
jgi:putative transposase